MDVIQGKIGQVEVGDPFPVRIMGVINLTADSFYSGSVRGTMDDVRREAQQMAADGADIIDLGARSTAPYKKIDVRVDQEEKILGDAVKVVCDAVDVPVSADTVRLLPAKIAMENGATIVNHVHGMLTEDSDRIAQLVASHDAFLVVAAHEARPQSGSSPIHRVIDALEKSVDYCKSFGVREDRLTIDPAIGFFKDEKISNLDWNCSVLAELEKLRKFNLPLCVGMSRKRFLGTITGGKPPKERLEASLGATAVAVYNRAHIIRTHDVKATKDAVLAAQAIREKRFIRSGLQSEPQ